MNLLLTCTSCSSVAKEPRLDEIGESGGESVDGIGEAVGESIISITFFVLCPDYKIACPVSALTLVDEKGLDRRSSGDDERDAMVGGDADRKRETFYVEAYLPRALGSPLV